MSDRDRTLRLVVDRRVVDETAEDLEELQALLDHTYAVAGPHLLDIVRPERRLDAATLSHEMPGLCLLALATVSKDGRPFVGPVDSIFYRGHFYFSTGPEAVRMRHLARNPAVSGTFVPRETFATTVHGVATSIDHHDDQHAGFLAALLRTFVPMYGEGFADFVDEIPTYFRIDANRQYCYYRAE